jgi:hypothetical protein
MKRFEKPPEIDQNRIAVEGTLLSMINNLLDFNRLQLNDWEKGFLWSLLEYKEISQKQADVVYRIEFRMRAYNKENYTPEGVAKKEALRKEIAAALKKKEAEKRQERKSREPSQPVVLHNEIEYENYREDHPDYDLPDVSDIPFDGPYIIRGKQ